MHKITQMKTKLDKQTKFVLAIFAVLLIILYFIVASKINKERRLNGGFKQMAFLDLGEGRNTLPDAITNTIPAFTLQGIPFSM